MSQRATIRPAAGRRRLSLPSLASMALGALTTLSAAAPMALAPGAAHAQFVCQGAAGADGASATNTGAVACGTNALASGANSSAIGPAATASGDSSSARGQNSIASGLQSTADGFTSLANGPMSTALGGRSKAGATFSTAVGWANNASGLDAFAGGNKSVASGVSSVALGDVAQASGDLSVAIGKAAVAQGANSVALGSGSVAAADNTVSVGSDTQQRRITNLAAGTGVNDAATFGQLQTGLGALDSRINEIRSRADGGAAAAMAVAGLPQAFTPGKGMVGLAIGSWGDETAFAVGVSKVLANGKVAFKVGAAFDGRGTGGANAGVGFQF